MLIAKPSTNDKFESFHKLEAEPLTYENFLFFLPMLCHMLKAQPDSSEQCMMVWWITLTLSQRKQ